MTSVDRYVCLRSPLRHRSTTTDKRSTLIKILAVWTLSVCIAGPLFVLSMLNRRDLVQYKGCGPETQAFVVSATVASFYAPLAIMTVMYALTVRALKRQLREQSCLTVNNASLNRTGTSLRFNLTEPEPPVIASVGIIEGSSSTCPLTGSLHPSAEDSAADSRQQQQQQQQRGFGLDADVVESTYFSMGIARRDLCRCSPASLGNCSVDICDASSASKLRLDASALHRVPRRRFPAVDGLRGRASNRGRRYGLQVPTNSVYLGGSGGRKQARPVRPSAGPGAGPDRGRRAVLVLGVLFAVFVVFYLPFFGVYFINATCSECRHFISDRIITGFEWLQYSGSMINPFVYHFFNPDFQHTFHRLLRCRT